jgi:hypothetical protein
MLAKAEPISNLFVRSSKYIVMIGRLSTLFDLDYFFSSRKRWDIGMEECYDPLSQPRERANACSV